MKVSAFVIIFAGVAIASPTFSIENKETQLQRRGFWSTAMKVVGTGLTSGVAGALLKTKIDENKEREKLMQDSQQQQAETKGKKGEAEKKKAEMQQKKEEMERRKGKAESKKDEIERKKAIASHPHHNMPRQEQDPAPAVV